MTGGRQIVLDCLGTPTSGGSETGEVSEMQEKLLLYPKLFQD
jgi:hypothetical protein